MPMESKFARIGSIAAQHSRECLLEVACGNATQVQDRQQGIERAGPACSLGQDR